MYNFSIWVALLIPSGPPGWPVVAGIIHNSSWEAQLYSRGWQAAALAMALLLASYIVLQLLLRGVAWDKFPPGPPGWPVIGNWPLLRSGSMLREQSRELSKKHGHGEILGLRIGWRRMVVVSSARMAKELLLTHDKTFANRPPFHFTNTLFYGFDSGIIFSSYTPRFSRLRKLYTLELFSAQRLHDLQFVRQEEIRHVIDHLISKAGAPVNTEKLVSNMSCNVTLRLLQSRALGEEQGPDLDSLVRELEHSSRATLSDFVPWLKWVALSQKLKMSRLHRKIDKVIHSMILERRELMKTVTPDKLPRDFLQVLLSKEAIEDEEERLKVTNIKANILDIISGGLHTTSVTVEWVMSELIANPRVMEKLQGDIDALKAGQGGQLVTDEDIAKLPYLENIVKETFRLHPVVPLLLTRMSSCACSVDGGKYMLPKGTQALVNVWAIGRDPELWESATEFRPERFESMQVDVKGQDYELLPFGSGRRICPGMRLGLALVHVTVANLVRFFDWHIPQGEVLDLSEQTTGRSGTKATRLVAIPTPRESLAG